MNAPEGEPFLAHAAPLARHRRLHVLLLGGTAEARQIANALSRENDVTLTVSLARPDRRRQAFGGPVRVGGWGGYCGFCTWLTAECVDAVIDATHPFATVMGKRTSAAANDLGIPGIRFMRPPWVPAQNDAWTCLSSAEEAAYHIPAKATVFLATGRHDLTTFANLFPRQVICRIKDTPDAPIPLANARYQISRGLVTVDQEMDLLKRLAVDWIVARNSGGQGGWPKLEAARSLGIPVGMIQRPPPADLLTISSVEAALNWIRGRI